MTDSLPKSLLSCASELNPNEIEEQYKKVSWKDLKSPNQ